VLRVVAGGVQLGGKSLNSLPIKCTVLQCVAGLLQGVFSWEVSRLTLDAFSEERCSMLQGVVGCCGVCWLAMCRVFQGHTGCCMVCSVGRRVSEFMALQVQYVAGCCSVLRGTGWRRPI